MLKPQEITEAIIDYLKDGEAEYAIMINGKWGTGKTYLWKKNIVPELEKDNKKNIYISLYGVNDIDKIEQKMLYQLLGVNDNYDIKQSTVSSITAELTKLADSFSKKVDFGKTNFKPITDLIFGTTSYFIFQALIRNAKNYVLCFDDLERIDANVKINQILGYIQQFVGK